MIEANPEIGHALNDPSTLRQMSEMMRNPNLMQEMIRNSDRAMSNIEAHPEGFNYLRRMYQNVQVTNSIAVHTDCIIIFSINQTQFHTCHLHKHQTSLFEISLS